MVAVPVGRVVRTAVVAVRVTAVVAEQLRLVRVFVLVGLVLVGRASAASVTMVVLVGLAFVLLVVGL